ncbi:MAG: HlyD family secretion protein [Candidatus Aminicenantales bacterium]
MKKFIIIFSVVIILISASTLLILRILPGLKKQAEGEGIIEVSGIIEAVETEIRAQSQGEVKRIFVEEGQDVNQGQMLCLLESEKLHLQLNQVRAALQGARAKLRLVEKGTKKELIAVAKNQLESAEKQMEIASKNQERMERLFKEGAISKTQKEEADLKLKLAVEQYESARENYELAKRGSEKEEVEMVKAEISNLVAKENILLRQIKDTEVRAPSSGYVEIRHIELGELALPGTLLFSLIDPTRTYVKAYVPEKYIGKLKTGDEVRVLTDSFPEKVFRGKIDFISDKAEFAPKDIQTREERLKLVFMVKSYLDNPLRELKPGMPVDVEIKLDLSSK